MTTVNETAPAVDTVATTETKVVRNLVSFKDLGMAFLLNGIPGLEALPHVENASRETHLKAIEHLRANSKDVSLYEGWMKTTFVATSLPSVGGHRGRAAAKAGDSRDYKTQDVGRSGPFLRLGLKSLGVAKGDLVRAEFLPGQIIITVAPAGAVASEPEETDAQPAA